jgi:hypothetical protein
MSCSKQIQKVKGKDKRTGTNCWSEANRIGLFKKDDKRTKLMYFGNEETYVSNVVIRRRSYCCYNILQIRLM